MASSGTCSDRPLNIAIILAGGSGSRAASSGAGVPAERQDPKQFWPLAGLPLWQHSWWRYASHPAIDKVCLVCPAAYVSAMRTAIAAQPEAVAPTYVIVGGRERSASSSRALEFCQQWQTPQRRVQVLLHDAARPLVSERMLDDTLAQLRGADAVVCAIASQDSLFTKNHGDRSGDRVEKILARHFVMRSQTPQSFELQTLRRAFALHQQRREIYGTDDISLVKHYLPEQFIAIVPGENYNIKLTEAADLNILTALYKMITANK